MASAGRILIIPRGNYDASTAYEMLDLVYYNGAAWVAKKSVTGVAPSETQPGSDYWMLMCSGANLAEVYSRMSQIETQMASAVSLDDIDLSECATKEELANCATKTELTNYATKSELENYLKLTGGTLSGDLGLGNGKGSVGSNEYVTMINSIKDSSNYRGIKIDNPAISGDLNSCASLVNTVGGVASEYKLFGEHNKDFLMSLISASVSGVKFETGTLGSNGTNTSNRKIPCSFAPKLIVVIGNATSGNSASMSIIIPDMGVGASVVTSGSASVGIINATRDGNNVILSHTKIPDMAGLYACFSPGLTYSYICVG